MSKPVFITLHKLDSSGNKAPIHVNANRVLWFEHHGVHGTNLHMNIPGTVLQVDEKPSEVEEVLHEAPGD